MRGRCSGCDEWEELHLGHCKKCLEYALSEPRDPKITCLDIDSEVGTAMRGLATRWVPEAVSNHPTIRRLLLKDHIEDAQEILDPINPLFPLLVDSLEENQQHEE
jgi:hypothetical protein